MPNFYRLNLPFNHTDIFNCDHTYDTYHTISVNLKNCLSDRFLDFFSENEFFPLRGFLFYCPPNSSSSIHIDGDYEKSRPFALNIAWGSTKSSMQWYNIKDKTVDYIESHTQANSPYLQFNNDQVDLIEQTTIDTISLVRTNIPHRIINYDTLKGRHCLSIRIDNIKTWEEAIIKFKQYL